MSSTFESFSSLAPMISINRSWVTGGTYTQYNHGRFINIHGAKTGFERLQKAVAAGAFHNSGERFDPPKCHPNTRTGVIRKIMGWILGQDPEMRSVLIMWLNGAAGAGKSAIAQSIAEKCYAEGYLVGSFFFSRSDPNRNHARSLFPSIAYQMALTFPQIQQKLSLIVERDPLIFTRSLSAQCSALIIEPLQDLNQTGYFRENPFYPSLVIIDGLDECLDREARRQILDIILQGMNSIRLPFIFLIASRPEYEISARFNFPDTQNILLRLLLDECYLPDRDLELLLRDKFKAITKTHPFKRLIPIPWPSDEAIRTLVRKSSGQFIYASTVIKYVESSRHLPHHRLEIIQNLRPPAGDRPFAELDALYTHISESCVEHTDLILRIIAFQICFPSAYYNIAHVERILSLEPGTIGVLFYDLSSIIVLDVDSEYEPDEIVLKMLHASLPDFLLDQARSRQFYIDIDCERTDIARKCVQYLSCEPFTDVHEAHELATDVLYSLRENTILSIDVQNDLYLISIPQWYQQINVENKLSPKSPEPEGVNPLYTYHLQSFHDILAQHLQVYFSDLRLTLLIAFFDFGIRNGEHRRNLFHPGYLLFKVDSHLLQMDARRFGLLSWRTHVEMNLLEDVGSSERFISIIHQYMMDPVNCDQYGLNSTRFADAARCCLTYLSDSYPAPITQVHQHCTEYMALIGDHLAYATVNPDEVEDLNDPDSWRQKYSLAVEYFTYFLQRSSPSGQLIECCRRATFLKFSRELPDEGERARKAVIEYLERTDSINHLQ